MCDGYNAMDLEEGKSAALTALKEKIQTKHLVQRIRDAVDLTRKVQQSLANSRENCQPRPGWHRGI
jgi:hypothetical protein